MTPEEIAEQLADIANECWADSDDTGPYFVSRDFVEKSVGFIRQAIKDERDACADLVLSCKPNVAEMQDKPPIIYMFLSLYDALANDIRNRK